MRQRDENGEDRRFIEFLNAIREGKNTDRYHSLMRELEQPLEHSDGIHPTHLVATNSEAKDINSRHMERLQGKREEFPALDVVTLHAPRLHKRLEKHGLESLKKVQGFLPSGPLLMSDAKLKEKLEAAAAEVKHYERVLSNPNVEDPGRARSGLDGQKNLKACLQDALEKYTLRPLSNVNGNLSVEGKRNLENFFKEVVQDFNALREHAQRSFFEEGIGVPHRS